MVSRRTITRTVPILWRRRHPRPRYRVSFSVAAAAGEPSIGRVDLLGRLINRETYGAPVTRRELDELAHRPGVLVLRIEPFIPYRGPFPGLPQQRRRPSTTN